VEKQEVAEENLVKKTCRELGITQKKLAEESGNSISSISKWSKGVRQQL
jgi:transcriptional regulator with XRE-family HTH domain